MNLFQRGFFTLASGESSSWKIDCDALRTDDWGALAFMATQILPEFSEVIGVPKGGLPFADALRKYACADCRVRTLLIAEDVVTTGGSIERFRLQDPLSAGRMWNAHVGVCVFARGVCPDWVVPLFQVNQDLWPPAIVEEPFVTFARTHAQGVHDGQKRWYGEDFITHPAAAAETVRPLGPEYEAVAWLHDVIEEADNGRDMSCSDMKKMLRKFADQKSLPEKVVAAVECLTRQAGETYLEYLLRICNHPDDIPLKVKLADIQHNLSTSKPDDSRGRHCRERWTLGLHILLNHKRPTIEEIS